MRLIFCCIALVSGLYADPSYGQAANPTYSSYSGLPELSGTQSVRLLPGFHAPAGSTLRVFITGTTSLGDGASSNQNYVQTTRYFLPLDAPVASPTSAQAMRDITYFDGLGRPLQQVGVKASGGTGYKDLVTPVTYDTYGRQDRDYLPYATETGAGGTFKSGAVAQQGSYYSGTGTVPVGQAVNPSPYGRRVYEPSPLDRVVEQGFPGAVWQPAGTRGTGSGRTVATEYTANNATAFGTVATTRMASRYRVTLAGDGTPTLVLDGTYTAGELYVTVTKDENWAGGSSTFASRLHTVEDYADKQGRVVLRRTFNVNEGVNEVLSTYYVYNDLGQLSFVLTPELGGDRTGTTAPTSAELTTHAYRYIYDGRGRLAEKRIPGRGAENYVHSPAGWLVFHQDARQRLETVSGFTPGQYHTFHKYDGQGRLVLKGVERNRVLDRASIQGLVDGHAYQWEERSTATGSFHGYTNRAIPQNTVDMDVLEVHYYDDYANIPSLPHNESGSYSKLTHGRLVASKVKVLDVSPAVYLWTVYYYDDKGNVVRERKQHYLGGSIASTKFDDITTEYTFTGLLKKETRKHHTTSTATPEVTVVTEYEYDHRERLTHAWKKINTGTRTLLARNTYNEVGQLRTKGIHSTDGTSFGQSVTYSYNARGWLSDANAGLFRQMLGYNAGSAPQYNGNIATQASTRHNMASPAAKVTDTYTYTYDAVGRLTEGTMGGGKGREKLVYYKNGNIRSLLRTGTGSATVDQLTYSYNTAGRLGSVVDAITADTDVNYQLPGTTNYTYDENGNLKTRVNSGSGRTGNNITATSYNYLDLPRSVTAVAGNVTYTYDGTGRKLRSVNGINGQTRDYIDGIEYSGGTMELIHTEEGRILRNGSTYRYHYFLRDHLGNNRVGFEQGTNVATPNFTADYYPFGLQYREVVRIGSPKNNYLYNGKELQDGLKQYDYGARFYDPVIGRWGSVDLLAEEFDNVSPYNYGLNNPLRFIDPTGMAAAPIYDEDGNLLGTDDEGLQGKAIVMNEKDFTQGMSHEEALKKNLGVAGLKGDEAKSNLLTNYNSLPSRPDYDGHLTLAEANEWFRTGNGQPLYVSLDKLDLSGINVEKFRGVGSVETFNLLLNSNSVNDGLVYGNIALKLYPNNRVRAYADEYDFRMHSWSNPLNWPRNAETIIGGRVAGVGTPYNINLTGSKWIRPTYQVVK
ncbi:DUF6443 domain-containing protein [Parapedobacter koreensis]|nr:DUF6443 domain-containing protein [Parapedobacter koreensis]